MRRIRWGDDRGAIREVVIGGIIAGVFAIAAAAIPIVLANRDSPPPAGTSTVEQTEPDDPSGGEQPAEPDGPTATEVFLSGTSAPGGSEIQVSGQGFEAGERVVLRVHTEEVGSTTASEEGSFSNVTIEVPESLSKFAPQQFSVVATGDSSVRSASAPLTVSG